MSTIHTVTLPDGTTAKRTSASRRYGYAIAVSPMPKAELVERLAADRLNRRGYRAEARLVLDYLVKGGAIVEKFGQSGYSFGFYAVNLQPGRSRSGAESSFGMRSLFAPELNGGETAEEARPLLAAYYERLVVDYDVAIADLDAKVVAASFGPELIGAWHVDGWASTAALALKASSAAGKHYPLRTVIALPAMQRETKPKAFKPSVLSIVVCDRCGYRASRDFVATTDTCPSCNVTPFEVAEEGTFDYNEQSYAPRS